MGGQGWSSTRAKGLSRLLTFDRYLLRSFAHVFATCYLALFGLMVVIDLLENLDDFLARNRDGGIVGLARSIGEFYAVQTIFFFDRAGPALLVISVMVVLILFQRSGELHPLLAAGIPMYRVLLPIVGAGAVVSSALALNQEMVIPRFAHAAYAARGGGDSAAVRVESIYDNASRISIDGRNLRMAERTIEQAEFVLPAPSIASDLTILKAERAVHCPAARGRAAGWKLSGVQPRYRDLELTEAGLKIIHPGENDDEAYVVTAVTCDQLYKRGSSYALLSTRELMDRIRSPAFGAETVHRLIVHLHGRFVQPLLNVIMVLLIIPLMVRRESPGLVVDSALCAVVLAVFFGSVYAGGYLGQSHAVAPDLAAWLPVVVGGSLSAWFSGVVRT